jgi:hypothetical protein
LWLDVLVLVLVLVSVAVMHVLVSGPVPSGADSGNWLAMAKELRGIEVMSADVTYPIVFPGFVAALLSVFSEIAAITIAGLAAKLVLVASVFWCLRGIGRGWAALGALLVGLSGAQLEAYAWGGFAQLLGTGAGILAVFFFGQYLVSAQRSSLLIALAWAILAYGTHTLVTGLVLIALGFEAAYWLIVSGMSAHKLKRAVIGLGVVALPGVVVAGISVLGSEAGVDPVLNPHDLNPWLAIQHATREAPLPWLVVAILALLFVFRPAPDDDNLIVKLVGLSWVVAGLAFFWYSGEPRSLLFVQTGIVILAVSAAARLVAAQRRRNKQAALWLLTLMLGFGLIGALVVGGVASYRDATRWYRVVATPELRVLDGLAQRAEAGDLVLASMGHHGNPIGWWVQGYAGVPTYASIDTRFLAFPDERQQANIANDFFSGDLSVEDSRSVVEATGADFLLVDRRTDHGAWLESDAARGLPRIANTGTIVLLDATPEPADSDLGAYRER